MKIINSLKKIVKNPKMILYYMDRLGLYRMDDLAYIKLQFKDAMGEELDIENPKTFNEKLQWLKLYDRKPEYTKMVDKYEAKKYVADLIGDEYIIPTIGIYDKFDDIDFDELPNQFVMKCTHDSGGLVICKDKTQLDIKKAKKKINKCLKRNFYYIGREWPYKNVKPRIIVEKYMVDESKKELIDYKFFCFNGEPKFLYVSEGLENHKTAKISFFDMNFNREKFKRSDYREFDQNPKKPVNFEKMKELAKTLSSGHTFLRVDLYEINNQIYFSELTFSPCAGYLPFEPVKYDMVIGNMIILQNFGGGLLNTHK